MRVQIFEGASSGEVSWSETLSVWGSVWMCHSVFTYTLLDHLVTGTKVRGSKTIRYRRSLDRKLWDLGIGRCYF
jgi:hypothetical protein